MSLGWRLCVSTWAEGDAPTPHIEQAPSKVSATNTGDLGFFWREHSRVAVLSTEAPDTPQVLLGTREGSEPGIRLQEEERPQRCRDSRHPASRDRWTPMTTTGGGCGLCPGWPVFPSPRGYQSWGPRTCPGGSPSFPLLSIPSPLPIGSRWDRPGRLCAAGRKQSPEPVPIPYGSASPGAAPATKPGQAVGSQYSEPKPSWPLWAESTGQTWPLSCGHTGCHTRSSTSLDLRALLGPCCCWGHPAWRGDNPKFSCEACWDQSTSALPGTWQCHVSKPWD